jgi:hypothetical protein
MIKIKKRLFFPEAARWLWNPVFPAAVAVSAVLILMDIFMGLSQAQINVSDLLDPDQHFSAISVIISSCQSNFIRFTSLCLCALPAVGIYAEDFEENAVYMRIQRLGRFRYALSRVLYTLVSSWLCAVLAEIVCILVFCIGFGLPILQEGGSYEWMGNPSALLQQGRVGSYLFILTGICGLRAGFYALLALAFTIYIPNRRVAFALPLLGWYFFRNILLKVDWIPRYLQPNFLYLEDFSPSGFIHTEWHYFLYLTLYTCLAGAVVFILLLRQLRKKGIFGGELE